MDPDELTTTLDNYNGYCTAKNDAQFGRPASTLVPIVTPPYYAMALWPGGPKKKRARGEAQRTTRHHGNPIPRLYGNGGLKERLTDQDVTGSKQPCANHIRADIPGGLSRPGGRPGLLRPASPGEVWKRAPGPQDNQGLQFRLRRSFYLLAAVASAHPYSHRLPSRHTGHDCGKRQTGVLAIPMKRHPRMFEPDSQMTVAFKRNATGLLFLNAVGNVSSLTDSACFGGIKSAT